MASHDWRLEMENMLAAFNRQTIHSLTIIKSTFNRSELLFSPEFKKYFLHASITRINEAYNQFQVSSMLEVQLNASLSSVANVTKRSARNCTNGVACETDDRGNDTTIRDKSGWITNASDSVTQIDDSDEVLIKALETKATKDRTVIENGSTSNANRNEIESGAIVTQNSSNTYDFKDGPVETDELLGINVSIVHQSNTNESYVIHPEVSSDFNFAVEMNELDDSVQMVENQNESIDADDDQLTTAKVVLDRLDETTIAGLTQGIRSNRKNPNKKRMIKMNETNQDQGDVTTKTDRSSPKRLASRNQKRCSVCGYVSLMGHLSRHMRIHSGVKLYGCDQCGRRFRSIPSLMKHAATHIAEFPFHCHACFEGFSSKSEKLAHEKRCKKRHYECHLCKKLVTFDKTELTTHMRKHTGDKPFCCQICMKRFVQKSHLKKHLNTIHSRINP